MSNTESQAMATGLAIIHGNRLEALREVLVHWMRSRPLGVLENETILVQSNGMAQWLQLALARAPDDPEAPGCGIAAALDFQLPAAFLWQAYRAVLGEQRVPKTSLYDKSRLGWRLLQLLPALIEQPACAQLRRFLAGDTGARKEYQLAQRLADLYDQYQVYRADWLGAWAQGRDVLIDAHGSEQALPEEQRWQPLLWRAIRADLQHDQRESSRADLHQQFLHACSALEQRPSGLPRRLIIFGISALPQQVIEALAALARHVQVLLCVHNPCRHYWADIIDGKDLLRSTRQRQARKPGMPVQLDEAELHLHANPLLAAWGKQGRDYIRLLDAFDDASRYSDWFQSVDLFEAPVAEGTAPLLLPQIQQDILDLEPVPAQPRRWRAEDASLCFQIAHSRQREVEVLHNQLLAWMQTDSTLKPRDIIVMMPDVNQYAPHIRAVFGRLSHTDPRYIPFTLNDQQQRGQAPLLIALELLLRLPQERVGVSQLFDLFEVPALRQRFGMAEAELPVLQRWIREAGIRWGLDSTQRAGLELPQGLEQNTWLFGLKRMLLGYLMGEGQSFAGIEAYAEIGGLEAASAGPLAELLTALLALCETLRIERSMAAWVPLLSEVLEQFFLPVGDDELLLTERLQQRLQSLQEASAEASLARELPLEVVREAWLEGIDERSLSQRFLGGAVNMATLMPMRAIPFRRVCLLGMNDGDYPRVQTSMDFDLMAGRYRPGDRSRREDDRYLFLEALLSAREALYISWVGRSVRDNSEQPPSVMVAQLRDYVQQGWQAEQGQDLLAQLSTEHPLHPFSPRYFKNSPRLFSFAAEWREVHEGAAQPADDVLAAASLPDVLPLRALGTFLRHPVRVFFNQRLNVWFDALENDEQDHEPFAFDTLQGFQRGAALISAALKSGNPEEGMEAQLARWQRAGELPQGPYARLAMREIVSPVRATVRRLQHLQTQWQPEAEPLEVRLNLEAAGSTVLLEGWVGAVYRSVKNAELALIFPSPNPLSVKGKPRWHRLVSVWVEHLALNAAGHRLSTQLVGPDTAVCLRPLAAEAAAQQLQQILAHYLKALAEPAPLACKTALALLTAPASGDPLSAARKVFYGDQAGSYTRGELEQDHYLQRAWPRFDGLLAAGLSDWAQALYQPLIEHTEVLAEGETCP